MTKPPTAPVNCAFSRLVTLEQITPNPRNPNRHTPEQIGLLAKNIMALGWRHPIIVSNQSGHIVSGHARLDAARQIGLTEAPVDFQDFRTPAEEMSYLIADNRIAELAERDAAAIKDLLQELDTGSMDMDLTGYLAADLERLMTQVHVEDSGSPADEDEKPAGELSDTVFSFGQYRFPVERDAYLVWQEQLRQQIGFDNKAAVAEIKKRLGLK